MHRALPSNEHEQLRGLYRRRLGPKRYAVANPGATTNRNAEQEPEPFYRSPQKMNVPRLVDVTMSTRPREAAKIAHDWLVSHGVSMKA